MAIQTVVYSSHLTCSLYIISQTLPITAEDGDSLGGSESLEYAITTVGEPQPSPFLAFTLSEDGSSLTTTDRIDR